MQFTGLLCCPCENATATLKHFYQAAIESGGRQMTQFFTCFAASRNSSCCVLKDQRYIATYLIPFFRRYYVKGSISFEIGTIESNFILKVIEAEGKSIIYSIQAVCT